MENKIKWEQKIGNLLTNSSSYPQGHKGKRQIKDGK
ncbi:MAG: hypothetical protein QT10_C0006G0016 [archaeon GW2011_AR19]|nr:MAG: hypothetical protein QT10_C0006G0016 [archaeon GW2011_AR19]